MSASLDKSQTPAAPAPSELPKPYFKPDGTLVIPFDSDPKYHWWKQGGQKLQKTIEAVRAETGSVSTNG